MKAKIGDYIKYQVVRPFVFVSEVYQGKLEDIYLEHDENMAESWIYKGNETIIPKSIEINGMRAAIRYDSPFSVRDCMLHFSDNFGCELHQVLAVSSTPFKEIPFEKEKDIDPVTQALELQTNRLEMGCHF